MQSVLRQRLLISRVALIQDPQDSTRILDQRHSSIKIRQVTQEHILILLPMHCRI